MNRFTSLTKEVGPHLSAFEKGVAQFNRGEFWACHETLEAVWLDQHGPVRDFYKGLIQAAAGLHHLSQGNLRGVDIVLGRAIAYLEPFASHSLGVNVAGLIQGSERCRWTALELGSERLREFDQRLIPRLEFDPQNARLHPASGLVQINNIKLHYWDWGGQGRPIIFLHGNGFVGRLWQPVAESLSPRYRAIAIDQRGHGDSDAPQADYDWGRFVDDLLAFVGALGLDRPIVVGHSLGGAVAAYAEIQAPGTFESLALIDPIVSRTDEARASSEAMAERARKRRMLWSSRREMFESYRPREPFDSWREDVLRLYVDWGSRASRESGVVMKCSGEVEAQVYENGSSLDTFARLTAIKCPTLVLRGEDSEVVPQQLAEAIAARLAKGRLVTIPGTSHFVPMEQPEVVAEAINEFLDE